MSCASIVVIIYMDELGDRNMQLDKIIQMAKDHILKHGQHLPEIIVELDTQEMHVLAALDITNSDSNTEKQHRFFTAGRMIGEDNPGTNIEHVAFIVEAWMGQYAANKHRPYDQPSKDPNRKECLVITTLDVIKKEDGRYIEQGMHAVEMIRDGSGKLVDLLPWELERGKVHSTLLTAFLAGFTSTQLSKEQKDDLLANMLGPDATGEEVQKLSKKIYERKMYMKSFTPSDIPRKQSTTSYRKTKKHRK